METPQHVNASRKQNRIIYSMSSSLNLKLKRPYTAIAAALGPLRSLRRYLTYPKLMVKILLKYSFLMREDDIYLVL